MSKILFFNGTLLAEDGEYPGWLLVAEGRIAQMGRGLPPEVEAERLDLGGLLLGPGMIDLHVHGALGHDTMDATPEALQAMARFYAQHGVTAFLPTTTTAPLPVLLAALENVARFSGRSTGGAAVLGAHVEGPYLNAERRGAQEPAHMRPADPAEYRRLLGTGVVRLLTLAPEIVENRQLIRDAVAQGVAVAVGHTRASYEEMVQAVELGVTQVTHLFNGMEPLHHRQPGAVGAALALEGLRCQLIADLIHIHPAVLKLAVRAKGTGNIILITDAMSGTGMPDGEYTLGGQRVTVQQGAARIASGALAGSTLTLDRAVRNIMAAADLPLAEALSMASRVPAQALGLAARKGGLAVGKDADLIVVDREMNVHLTLVGGEVVHRRALV